MAEIFNLETDIKIILKETAKKIVLFTASENIHT